MEAIPLLKLTQVILGHAKLIADANWERSYAQDSPMHCKHPNLKKNTKSKTCSDKGTNFIKLLRRQNSIHRDIPITAGTERSLRDTMNPSVGFKGIFFLNWTLHLSQESIPSKLKINE